MTQLQLVPHRRPDEALAAACTYVLGRRRPDGHFDGTAWQSAAGTAQVVIVEHALGALTSDDAARAVRYFERGVRPDGGFAAFHGADHGTLADAAQIDAALACCGCAASHPLRRTVRRFIDASGGLLAVDPISALFLVLAGTLPASALPAMPVAHALVPGIDRWLGRRFLAYHALFLGYLVPGLVHALRGRHSLVGRAAARRIADYLIAHQNRDGNWAGGQWVTCLATACLYKLGLPRDHAAIRGGLATLERSKLRDGDGLAIVPFNLDVWNTAVALRALDAARCPWPQGARAAAVDYLLAAQCRTNAPRDWSNVASERTDGGWAAASGNELLSDTDTTAVVMHALAGEAAAAEARARGERWLLAMQNADGGFGAFTRGHRSKPPGPLFGRELAMPSTMLDRARTLLRPPLELVDHSTADVTARAAGALAALGHGAGSPALRRAVEFLDGQREVDRWWCRWTTNYVAGTAFVLDGAGRFAGERWAAARAWLRSCQHADGGWGETNASYARPELAGRGPSNAYATGLAILALADDPATPRDVLAAGIAYLCASQAPTGGWVEREAIQTVVPPTMFYTNETNFQLPAISALAAFVFGHHR